MGLIDSRLAELGIVLPTPMKPVANYVPWVKTGDLVFISGQGAVVDGKIHYQGRLGDTVSIEDGIASARLTAINILAQLREACDGDLDRVTRIVKLVGFVSAIPDFIDHPKIINGASDLMAEVFGNKGRHARSAVGVPSLPLNFSVEIDAVVEIA
jgi:enamine deaminase RidA (YjgF/YER057c/UK114 family)